MSKNHVICFNGGSSSIKVAVKDVSEEGVSSVVDFNCQGLGTPHGYVDVVSDGKKERWEMVLDDHSSALHAITEIIGKEFPDLNIAAVGHRVVHGGTDFTESALIDGIDGNVQAEILACSSLAPLHNPANHQIIIASLKDPVFGAVPNVAVFDTQFHANMPDYAKYYGVPKEWIDTYGIQRYGFHGTSYTYISGRFSELTGMPLEKCNMVIAHLGNGCSMAKVEKGTGVDTSMGVTPLEGLIMGTRSGDVDPGMIELMAENLGVDVKEIVRILNRESGAWGLYGKGTKEIYKIREAVEAGDTDAALTLDVISYRIAKYFSEYLGTMEDPMGIIFTGGVGENEGYVRKRVLSFMKMFKWDIDEEAIMSRNKEVIIAESACVEGLKAWVIPTDEEKVFALEAIKHSGL